MNKGQYTDITIQYKGSVSGAGEQRVKSLRACFNGLSGILGKNNAILKRDTLSRTAQTMDVSIPRGNVDALSKALPGNFQITDTGTRQAVPG